jgi:DNA modification methylase/superfamily II DNA or RNA helicase
MTYEEFLKTKKRRYQGKGREIDEALIHPKLFAFQRRVTAWAIRKGRCALFLDTGLGKTFCQLEWARLLNEPALIVAPLSVARQTVREAKKIDLEIKYIRSRDEIVNTTPIHITNYEMIDRVTSPYWRAVVLDESSILKSFDGKTRGKLIRLFDDVPYRLACTATPAPNDQVELGNHTEFLGVCRQNEMLSEFFIHANKVTEQILPDGSVLKIKQSNKNGQEWRLRNYAKNDFYRWLSSWAMSMKAPSNLGFDDDGFKLPPLNVNPVYIPVTYKPEGKLFFDSLKGIQERGKVRRETVKPKIDKALEIVNGNREQWIVWCGLNDESEQITPRIEGAIEVKGNDDPEYKAQMIEDFQDGKFRVLVTKPKIAGFGMNFQNAHNMLFLGLSDSWEAYYQCIRRQWRFGQMQPVNVWIVLSDVERAIYENVLRKETIATGLHNELMKLVKNYELEELGQEQRMEIQNETNIYKGEKFTAHLGDSCEVLKTLEGDSIDLSVYSPPFADLYTYTATERDLGNSRDWDEFFSHYAFIVRELLRVTKQGRNTCVHTSDIPAMSMKDGYIGIRDFPGAVIAVYEREGWIFYGRAIVTKNPQAQAIRTKSKALLFTQLRKDSSDSRPALLDHILIFKKPGKADRPVEPVKNNEIDNEKWIDWAGGIWTGIQESDVLQYSRARADDDEKHICPLQLGTIERCIKLYSNPGETVLTPFGGIGSEAYQAIRFGRKAVLIELKKSYYDIALQNLIKIEKQVGSDNLFSWGKMQKDETELNADAMGDGFCADMNR